MAFDVRSLEALGTAPVHERESCSRQRHSPCSHIPLNAPQRFLFKNGRVSSKKEGFSAENAPRNQASSDSMSSHTGGSRQDGHDSETFFIGGW